MKRKSRGEGSDATLARSQPFIFSLCRRVMAGAGVLVQEDPGGEGVGEETGEMGRRWGIGGHCLPRSGKMPPAFLPIWPQLWQTAAQTLRSFRGDSPSLPLSQTLNPEP